MIYVDTSVVVTALDCSEPTRSKAASRLLDGRSDKVVSELFLVELAAAVSRRPGLVEAAGIEEAKPSAVLLAYLVYLMSKYGLKLLDSSGGRVFTPLGRVGEEAGSSLELAAALRLRSLDLLHVAHLLSLKGRGHAIETLMTSDGDFLKAEKLLGERGVKLVFLNDAE